MRQLSDSDLRRLDEAWEAWTEAAPSASQRRSRERLRLVYLLVRHGALRLGEALRVNDLKDFDLSTTTIRIGGTRPREVQVSERAMAAMRSLVGSPDMEGLRGRVARLDQGYVRKRFYDVARACGLEPGAGGPQVLRQSRAAELLRANVPLGIVQKFLGQRSPAQAAAFMRFSDQEARRIVHAHLRGEALRRSTARNAFTGSVTGLSLGEVSSLVELTTLAGARLHVMVTIESVQRLGLALDQVATCSVKASCLELSRPSAGGDGVNRFRGRVAGLSRGEIESSVVVELEGGTALCSVLPSEELDELGLREGDEAEVSFSPFSALLGLPAD